jgi:hypothetical protein
MASKAPVASRRLRVKDARSCFDLKRAQYPRMRYQHGFPPSVRLGRPPIQHLVDCLNVWLRSRRSAAR